MTEPSEAAAFGPLAKPADAEKSACNDGMPLVQEHLYEAGCDLEQLAHLFGAIADQLGAAYDPHRVGAPAASLARLGFDGIGATLKKLQGAEDACASCWKGRATKNNLADEEF